MWKFVIKASGILNSYGGKTNLFVQPSNGLSVLSVETEDSIDLTEVVPTAHIFLLVLIPSLTILAHS